MGFIEIKQLIYTVSNTLVLKTKKWNHTEAVLRLSLAVCKIEGCGTVNNSVCREKFEIRV